MQCFTVYKAKAFFKKCVAKQKHKTKDATSKETANCEIDLKDRTGKQILCALKEMKWDGEFISNKLTREDRQNTVREMIAGAVIKDTSLNCQRYHPIKKLDLTKLIDSTNTKLKKNIFKRRIAHILCQKNWK